MKNFQQIIPFNEWKNSIIINEDVTIPSELSQQYLSIKKQIADKQSKKDQVIRAANQIDSEINRLTQNLIAIEAKAAQLQGKTEQKKVADKVKQGNNPNPQAKPAESTATTESLDLAWEKYMNENIADDFLKYPELDIFATPEKKSHQKPKTEYIDFDQDSDFIKDYDDDYEESDEIEDSDDEETEGDSLEGDYVFALEIEEESEDEPIIAKIYKDSDEENWKIRVVQGNEEPLETMQIDSDLSKNEVIDKISEIPGFSNIKELDINDYEDLVNDKEDVDSTYYDDIIDVT